MPQTQSIWCLFTIENDYSQPDFNLFMWFAQKPTVAQLEQVWRGFMTEEGIQKNRDKLQQLADGHTVECLIGDKSIRLEEVQEATRLIPLLDRRPPLYL